MSEMMIELSLVRWKSSRMALGLSGEGRGGDEGTLDAAAAEGAVQNVVSKPWS